jgi:hypothetical protein
MCHAGSPVQFKTSDSGDGSEEEEQQQSGGTSYRSPRSRQYKSPRGAQGESERCDPLFRRACDMGMLHDSQQEMPVAMLCMWHRPTDVLFTNANSTAI